MPDETQNIVKRFRQVEEATREKVRAARAHDILPAVAYFERMQKWAKEVLEPRLNDRVIKLSVENCFGHLETHRRKYDRAVGHPNYIV